MPEMQLLEGPNYGGTVLKKILKGKEKKKRCQDLNTRPSDS